MFYQEETLLRAVWEAEAAAIHLRQFAASALRPERSEPDTVGQLHTGVEVSVTAEGWLKITLPAMLPHRGEKDPARFLNGPIHEAIHTCFRDKPRPRFRACVLVYEHIYDAARPRRRVTDHDNLELKHVQDVLEAAFLENDSAALCSAFQCSHMGDSDGTCIWILSPEQFPMWLESHRECWAKAPKSCRNSK